ncbi:hypothetical protein OIU74_029174 [Salix koriyanagi]|uniref:Phosphatidic acid phosphatase type 2/haloperoxidase domain-containing protein n=1 Tax=Salix koriyanagi TaxID=2511006 RepID=A0A9Q0ZU53_9ROSI|nr:hypothetical protein OIU74_029174 [Salix koriyanagi]
MPNPPLKAVTLTHGTPLHVLRFRPYYFPIHQRVEGIGLSQIKNKWAVNFFPWSLAVLTMFSRVYLGYHTVAQVFAGAALGVFLGACWFWVVNNVIYEYFPVIEESMFGRMLFVKDTSHIKNVLKFEYDNARAARKSMADKAN